MSLDLKGHALCDAFHQPILNFLGDNPGDYLEIGLYYGHFFTRVADQFPNKSIIGIDPFISDGYTRDAQGTIIIDIEEIARYNASQVNNATLYKTTTEDFLKREDAFQLVNNVSCVLIDGSHHYDDIMFDLNLVLGLQNDYDKFVIFDDLQIQAVVASAAELKNRLSGRIKDTYTGTNCEGIYFK